MATLYVGSTETFVGKSAVCVGLLSRAQRDGFSIGYMKPISASVKRTDDAILDEDAEFVRQHFGLKDSLERMTPGLLTQSVVEQIMRGQGQDLSRKVSDAYVALSRDKDFVVLEGANTWAEGSLVNLSADQISDMLQAPVLMVSHYRSALTLDTIIAVKRYLGDRLLGVLLNQVDEPQMEYVKSRIVPFLEKQQIPVFGVLAQERGLAGATVADLLDQLGGQYIGSQAQQENLVESLMIGALGAEAALSHFRRRANKAVFTGGDRSDIQLAALETSTAVLVLTGNIRPAPAVIDKAEDRNVPLILLADDTLSAVERAEQIFGHVRFKQAAKIERFTALMDEQFDYKRLYDELGIVVG